MSTFPRKSAVMVRDRVSGDVLAILRRGTADLSQFGAPDRVELLLSDGGMLASSRMRALARSPNTAVNRFRLVAIRRSVIVRSSALMDS
ncbi:MAG: hypothetical protein ABMA00_11640 [Gemmatimonas sp.]